MRPRLGALGQRRQHCPNRLATAAALVAQIAGRISALRVSCGPCPEPRRRAHGCICPPPAATSRSAPQRGSAGRGLRSRIDRAHNLDVSRGRGERGVGVEVGEWEGRARPGGRSVLRQAKRRQEQEQAPLPSARPSGCLPRRTPSIAARTCARCISPSLRSISAQSPVLVPPLVEPTPSIFAQPPNQPSQPCVSHHRLSYPWPLHPRGRHTAVWSLLNATATRKLPAAVLNFRLACGVACLMEIPSTQASGNPARHRTSPAAAPLASSQTVTPAAADSTHFKSNAHLGDVSAVRAHTSSLPQCFMLNTALLLSNKHPETPDRDRVPTIRARRPKYGLHHELLFLPPWLKILIQTRPTRRD